MIPQRTDDVILFSEEERQTGRTYRLDIENEKVMDYTDEMEAVKQAIYKILNTERYRYPIYSWNYGVELSDLIGQPMAYTMPTVQRRIEEALTQDDRIQSVDAFSFEQGRGTLHVTFTVHSIYGDVEGERMIINV
ncbi:DUF2634 domain-containing protein [Bacilliculturomica massiliensis]|uniref:DUF2634 domain-containing protein n=1 Tax=Bacilliculturomica massiliensis TaxID=1917867 RepID=UPI001031B1CC|nr:DUF2634 domain-containing protein [Bacilliculturomica massiliensis]